VKKHPTDFLSKEGSNGNRVIREVGSIDGGYVAQNSLGVSLKVRTFVDGNPKQDVKETKKTARRSHCTLSFSLEKGGESYVPEGDFPQKPSCRYVDGKLSRKRKNRVRSHSSQRSIGRVVHSTRRGLGLTC